AAGGGGGPNSANGHNGDAAVLVGTGIGRTGSSGVPAFESRSDTGLRGYGGEPNFAGEPGYVIIEW
ncbi:MAG: hypothetical protein ACOYN0_06780, partial [Phycisphaerales bacterium]